MDDNLNTTIKDQIRDSAANLSLMAENEELQNNIQQVVSICLEALRNGNKILFAGNGGSAADCQHLAGELVSRFHYDRPGLPAVALTTDTSILTAVGNDYGYEYLFARQIEAIANNGDVFFGISTSGRSPNILKALRTAREKGVVTVGMTGKSGGDMTPLCEHCLRIPADSTPRIQEGHILVGHIICCLIEQGMFPKS
jgi:D-sedoheptulose 7-phosphate isomerase